MKDPVFNCTECKKNFNREVFRVGTKFCSFACCFWSGVDYHGAGCWIWKKKKNNYGYAVMRWGKKKGHFSAHRIGYALHHNLPDLRAPGIMLFNTCGNRACVRGDHWTTDSAWKWVFSQRYNKEERA